MKKSEQILRNEIAHSIMSPRKGNSDASIYFLCSMILRVYDLDEFPHYQLKTERYSFLKTSTNGYIVSFLPTTQIRL